MTITFRLISLVIISSSIFKSDVSFAKAADLFPVDRIVDCDTIVLGKIGKVRLIGVDTPETKDPRTPVQYFGKEAAQFLTKTLSGKKVSIEYDQTRTDRYGRTLGYIYLEDGLFVNALIIEQGYGYAYTKFPFKYMDRFKTLERKAREQKRGLWADQSKQESSPTKKAFSQFSCNIRKTCSQIKTCDEAKFLLKECGFGRLDGDKDGVPCEKLCGNSK